ncbi:MAG TPA: hypothetical protein VD999_07485 [Vitreimonas sp.]|nr:hypothetical protein [Vitreimonas sp.]
MKEISGFEFNPGHDGKAKQLVDQLLTKDMLAQFPHLITLQNRLNAAFEGTLNQPFFLTDEELNKLWLVQDNHISEPQAALLDDIKMEMGQGSSPDREYWLTCTEDELSTELNRLVRRIKQLTTIRGVIENLKEIKDQLPQNLTELHDLEAGVPQRPMIHDYYRPGQSKERQLIGDTGAVTILKPGQFAVSYDGLVNNIAVLSKRLEQQTEILVERLQTQDNTPQLQQKIVSILTEMSRAS